MKQEKTLINNKSGADSQIVGGKAANLIILANNGISVPDAFFLTIFAFEQFIKENALEKDIETLVLKTTLPGVLHKGSSLLRKKIINGEVSASLKKKIETEFNKRNFNKVSVRSSVNLEDGIKSSFAGQFESYLFVKKDQLINKMLQIWASTFSPRVLVYALKNGVCPSLLKPGLIIQEMVDADVAGVAFTRNLLNGNSNQMIIESCVGTGDKMVDGLVEPNRYLIDRFTKRLVSHTIKNKKTKLKASTLSSLVLTFLEIEDLYGLPQDIEWAIKDEQIYILQSRNLVGINRGSNYDKVSEESKWQF